MLPTEHYGFKDQEARYRKRYLDLIMNDSVENVSELDPKSFSTSENSWTTEISLKLKHQF